MASTWTQYMIDPSGQYRTFRGLSEEDAIQQSVALQGQGWTIIQRVLEPPQEQQTQPVSLINPDGSQTIAHDENSLAQALSSGSLPTNDSGTGFHQVGADPSGNYTINGQSLAQALGTPTRFEPPVGSAAEQAFATMPGVWGPVKPTVSSYADRAAEGNAGTGMIGEDQAGQPASAFSNPQQTTSEAPGTYEPFQPQVATAPGTQAPASPTNPAPAYTTALPNPSTPQTPGNFDELLQSLQSQVQGRLGRSDAITDRTLELSDFLRDQFTNNAVMRDNLISQLFSGSGGNPGLQQTLGEMMGRANVAEGLSPEAMSALRTQATSTIPTQFNQAAEQLRTQLLNRGVTGGTQPTAAGPFINKIAPLLAGRDAAVAKANQDTILANEQYKRDSLNQNRANALNAAAQTGGMIGSFGNIYNPVPYAQGALSGFNTTLGANQGSNNLLGLATQLAGVQGEAQPGSVRNLILASLLGAGSNALRDWLGGLLGGGGSNNQSGGGSSGSGTKLNVNLDVGKILGGLFGGSSSGDDAWRGWLNE